MALQNVSDVIDDPDFWSEAILIQAIVTVNGVGIAEAKRAGTAFTGVIWPGNGLGLVQSGEGDWVEGDLMIVTRFPIDTGRRETAADGVIFGDLPYTITNVQLWPFGDQFTQAVCKLATINPSLTGPRANVGALG
ncbi:hypothetical protein [Methylobacterium fujisawaense]|uniref:hypothetical protein n=1 Tax=Methylobacterium fujisawaense TaxID=107400 RepID=UPI00313EE9E4